MLMIIYVALTVCFTIQYVQNIYSDKKRKKIVKGKFIS